MKRCLIIIFTLSVFLGTAKGNELSFLESVKMGINYDQLKAERPNIEFFGKDFVASTYYEKFTEESNIFGLVKYEFREEILAKIEVFSNNINRLDINKSNLLFDILKTYSERGMSEYTIGHRKVGGENPTDNPIIEIENAKNILKITGPRVESDKCYIIVTIILKDVSKSLEKKRFKKISIESFTASYPDIGFSNIVEKLKLVPSLEQIQLSMEHHN